VDKVSERFIERIRWYEAVLLVIVVPIVLNLVVLPAGTAPTWSWERFVFLNPFAALLLLLEALAVLAFLFCAAYVITKGIKKGLGR
jgi:hypothetical protein